MRKRGLISSNLCCHLWGYFTSLRLSSGGPSAALEKGPERALEGWRQRRGRPMMVHCFLQVMEKVCVIYTCLYENGKKKGITCI